eukprot:3918285-Alexandrium_andersonii.AAC.2
MPVLTQPAAALATQPWKLGYPDLDLLHPRLAAEEDYRLAAGGPQIAQVDHYAIHRRVPDELLKTWVVVDHGRQGVLNDPPDGQRNAHPH